MKKKQPISTTADWTIELIDRYDKEIGRLAHDFKLDTYPIQLEIISSEQMMDAYASAGMPIGYHHWSYGKRFLDTEMQYRRGAMGLAYEIVINSNPCIAYLMEENSMAMQALVIAHAAYGHNSFFKNNYLFQSWTHADSIVDYLVFAKNYITECEQRHGIAEVERFIDHCHALQQYGVDRYKRPVSTSLQQEKIKQRNREHYRQLQVNDIWRTLPEIKAKQDQSIDSRFPQEPQENLLYFIEKNAPLLEPWQREIIRIVRKLAQYFYPQKQTQVMNEGWACFWHHTLMNALYDEGLVTDEFMLEVIQSHSSVIFQPDFDDPRYSGINPYTLGYNMMKDIQRIASDPTDEDRKWFPNLAGTDWLSSLDFAMRNFKDESFIAQYLSPALIRDLKLFSVLDDDQEMQLVISAIHNEHGYQAIRDSMSQQYNLSIIEPNIQVFDVDVSGDRAMTLRHYQHQRQPLHEESLKTILSHLHALWGFPVTLESIGANEQTTCVWHFPEREQPQSQNDTEILN